MRYFASTVYLILRRNGWTMVFWTNCVWISNATGITRRRLHLPQGYQMSFVMRSGRSDVVPIMTAQVLDHWHFRES